MNRNTIFKLGAILIALVLVVGVTAFAQQRTWYVNNSAIGNDGRNGLSPTIPSPDDGVTGPKKTLGGAQGAIAEAVAGDIIVVATTGVPYGTGTGEPATIVVNKKLTFRSTGGEPNITSLVQINNANAAPDNVVIFDNGPFRLSGGLTLTAGVVTNSSQLLTVGGTITRSAATAVVNGQLLYTGTVDFSYGATMTTADEFPSSGSFRNLTTTAGALTLKTTTATMTGTLATAGSLNLGGNTLAISGANAHTIGGNVTNGSLSFTLTGNASVTGNFNLPAVTVTKSTTGLATLTIATNTSVASITATGNASVTFSGANVTIGAANSTANNVLLSGAGIISLPAGVTVNGNVVLNSTGLTAANTAQITFAGAATVNGSVRNEATFTVADNAALNGGTTGLITFADAVVTITGDVTNNVVVGGTIGTLTDAQNVGQIRFANTTNNVTIQGAIRNGSSTSISTSTNPGVAFNGLGNVVMTAITTGDVRVDGGIVNNSNWSTVTGANNTNNGRILIGGAGRTLGSAVGSTANRVGAIISSSLGRAWNDGNGDIVIAGDNTSDGFFGTSVTASGSAVGGKVVFANEAFNVSGGVSLGRSYGTGANDVIQVGSAGTAGAAVTIGGGISNTSNNNITFPVLSTGALAVTGTVSSSASGGTITFPNIGATSVTFGGLNVSAGTVSIPVTHDGNVTINGTVSVSGGTVSLLANGSDVITISGNASFTGGTVTTTGRTQVNLNGANLTFGGTSANTTFSTATTAMVIGNPTPAQTITVTVGDLGPALAGDLTVNNTTGLAVAVDFTGGALKVNGALTFTSGVVRLSGSSSLIVVGNFTNTAGYQTPTLGRVTLEGGAGQTFGGAGDFGNIEFKNAAGIATASAVKLTGSIYLTAGAVANTGGAITIENTTTLPTIVRNAGTFAQAPTFNSSINVTYIGSDKASGNEVPADPTRLQNLTVATTTGAVAGRGVVTIGVATTVNGTINVYPGQTLLIDAVTLTMKGASIVLDGDIANEGAGLLSLARTTGTTITGSGYLPPVSVAAGSMDNVINGARALVHQLVGTDNVRSGDDFDPTAMVATGDLTLGNGAAKITVTFGSGALNSTHVQNVTTSHADNVLVLGGNVNASGNLTHAAGTIDLGANVLNFRGMTHAYTGGALVTGTGTLRFTTTGASTLTINTAAAAIGANVDVVSTAGTLTLDNTGQDLTISGNLSISGTANGLDIGAGRTLTVTGSSVSLASGTSITATTGGTTGILRLNAATPPLTLSGSGAVTIANLTVANGVTLSLSGTSPSMTVSTAFVHSGGEFNFGAYDLTISGTYNRTGGTYAATTGYLVINNTTFNRGTSDFSVPNLRFTANAVFGGSAVTTVTSALSLRQAGAVNHTVSGAVKLTVADGATVNYRSGSFTNGTTATPPTYAGSITLVADNPADNTMIDASVWPSTPATLVSTFRVNGTAGNDVQLPGSRTVNSALQLYIGNLDLSHATTGRTLTIADGATITRRNTSLIRGVSGEAGDNATNGSVSFGGNATNVVYQANAVFTSGAELSSSINNLTITRSTNVVNAAVTVNKAVTVNGTLTVRNDLSSTAAGILTVMGNVVVESESATYSNATAPVFTLNAAAPVTFAGSANQTITVPSTGATIGSIRIAKASSSNTVTIAGGNLTCTGTVTFVNGLLMTGNNVIEIAQGATLLGSGFDRTGVTAGNVSHVVGFVRKVVPNAPNIPMEFPVGTNTKYRPVTFTFSTAPAGVSIIVSHVETRPSGTVGLPITDGIDTGVDIARYPGFYWDIRSNVNIPPTYPYALAMTAEGFTAPTDYDNVANLRLIRRIGGPNDVNNTWTKQGVQYDNYEAGGVPTVQAINLTGAVTVSSAIFTYGLKSNMVIANPFTIPTLTDAAPTFRRSLRNPALVTGNTGALSFTASIDNPAIATVSISNDTLIVTRKVSGTTTVRVTATDAADGSRITYSTSLTVVTKVETIGGVPTEFALEQNFPNPFNPSTMIRFALPKEAPVTLVIYNMLGVPVRTLINGEQLGAANHQITWDGKDDAGMTVPSGMYLYRISAGSFQAAKKMTLLK